MEKLAPHARPSDEAEYLASLTPVERRLQELAQEKLGSCYFMAKTNGYRKWKAKKDVKK